MNRMYVACNYPAEVDMDGNPLADLEYNLSSSIRNLLQNQMCAPLCQDQHHLKKWSLWNLMCLPHHGFIMESSWMQPIHPLPINRGGPNLDANTSKPAIHIQAPITTPHIEGTSHNHYSPKVPKLCEILHCNWEETQITNFELDIPLPWNICQKLPTIPCMGNQLLSATNDMHTPSTTPHLQH